MSLDDRDLNQTPKDVSKEPAESAAAEAAEPENTANLIGLEDEELFDNSTVFSAPKEDKKPRNTGNKKLRNIIAAVVLVAILAGSVFAIVKFIPAADDEDVPSSSSEVLDIEVCTVDEKALKSVTVSNDLGDSFKVVPVASSVTGDDGNVTTEITWYLDGIDNSYSDTNTIGGLITRVTALKAVRVMDEAAADISVYGLDKPYLTVAAEADDGYTLIIGNESPAADGRYGMIEGSNKVYLIDSSVISVLDTTATDYVSVQMVTSVSKTDELAGYFDDEGLLSSFDYVNISGTAHENPIRIEMNPYDASSYIPYLMTAPVKQNVMGETGDAVLSPIKSGLMADGVYEIYPDAATVAKYGLDNPLTVIEYKVGSFTSVIKVAAATDDNGYYAVMVDDKPIIYKLVKSELSFAEKSPEQFFNNYIFLDDITTVKSVTVTTATGTRVYNLTHGVDENEEATLAVSCDGKELSSSDFRNLYQYMITAYASEFTMEAAPEGAAEITLVVDYTDDARENLTVAYKKATDRRYHVSVNGVPLGYAFLNTIDNLIQYETDYYNGVSVPKP